jgi:hypothetical protein
VNWLVDDQHLGALLRTGHRPWGLRRGDNVFTTGLWYTRLCQAALVAAEIEGVLSEPFRELEASDRELALAALNDLPAEVGLLSLRVLAPAMAPLRRRYQLNVLAAEALAAAVELKASVLTAMSSPRLEAALVAEGRRCVVRALQ